MRTACLIIFFFSILSSFSYSKNSTGLQQYIVVLKSNDSQNVEYQVQSLFNKIDKEYKNANRDIVVYKKALSGFRANLHQKEIKFLQKNSDVLKVVQVTNKSTNYFASQSIPNINDYSTANWGLDRIDQVSLPLDENYSYDADGTGVHMYIIDSGINSYHVEYSGRQISGYAKNNSIYEIGFWYDPEAVHLPLEYKGTSSSISAHGQWVTSIAVGNSYGVAKGSYIHPVKGTGVSNYIDSIEWILNHRQPSAPAVVNFSNGLYITDNPVIVTNGAVYASLDQIELIEDAVQNLIDAGITVVASAGNENTHSSCYLSPARMPGVITVGGTNKQDERWKNGPGETPSFLDHEYGSSYGACVDIFAPADDLIGAHIDENLSRRFHASGPDDLPDCIDDNLNQCMTTEHATAVATSLDAGGIFPFSGTSFSAPLVSGVAALYLEHNSGASPAEVKSALLKNASKNQLSDIRDGSPNLLLFNKFPKSVNYSVDSVPKPATVGSSFFDLVVPPNSSDAFLFSHRGLTSFFELTPLFVNQFDGTTNSWQSPVQVSTDLVWIAHTAVNSSGDIAAVWSTPISPANNIDHNVVVRLFDAQTATWSSETVLATDIENSKITVDYSDNGDVFVAYVDDQNPTSLSVKRFDASSNTWVSYTLLPVIYGADLTLLADSDGNAVLVGDDDSSAYYFDRYDSVADRWVPRNELSNSGVIFSHSGIWFTQDSPKMDSQGNIYLLASASNSEYGGPAIRVHKYENATGNWSVMSGSETFGSNMTANATPGAMLPKLSVDADGNLFIFWSQGFYLDSTNYINEHRYRHYSVGANQWSDSIISGTGYRNLFHPQRHITHDNTASYIFIDNDHVYLSSFVGKQDSSTGNIVSESLGTQLLEDRSGQVARPTFGRDINGNIIVVWAEGGDLYSRKVVPID